MKKFFSLKMALAVLVAGAAFTSCSDSDAGDIYVPGTTPGGTSQVEVTNFPDPLYVVSGVVTDAVTSAAVEGVAVRGAVSDDTDSNGFYTSGKLTAPIQGGTLTFTKNGYVTATRTVDMIALNKGQGVLSEVINVSLVPGEAPVPVPGGEPLPTGETATAPSLAKYVEVANPDSFVNNSDEEAIVLVDVKGMGLPYGANYPSSKVEPFDTFIEYCLYFYKNDPTQGYGVNRGYVPVLLPPHSKFVSAKFIPVVMFMVYKLEGYDETVDFDLIQSYQVEDLKVIPTDAHDPHDAHNGDNVGGGDSQGV